MRNPVMSYVQKAAQLLYDNGFTTDEEDGEFYSRQCPKLSSTLLISEVTRMAAVSAPCSNAIMLAASGWQPVRINQLQVIRPTPWAWWWWSWWWWRWWWWHIPTMVGICRTAMMMMVMMNIIVQRPTTFLPRHSVNLVRRVIPRNKLSRGHVCIDEFTQTVVCFCSTRKSTSEHRAQRSSSLILDQKLLSTVLRTNSIKRPFRCLDYSVRTPECFRISCLYQVPDWVLRVMSWLPIQTLSASLRPASPLTCCHIVGNVISDMYYQTTIIIQIYACGHKDFWYQSLPLTRV